MADNTIKIGGELESMATGKVVAAASAIKDKARNKTQEAINGDVEQAIAEQSAQFEALSEETSAAVASSSESAREAKQYLANLQEAITELPDGQAVSAQVAQHTVSIEGLEGATSLGEDSLGNAVKPSDVFENKSINEFIKVETDSEGCVLEGTRPDGTKYFPKNVEAPNIARTEQVVNDIAQTVEETQEHLAIGEIGGEAQYPSDVYGFLDTSEFIKVNLDMENRVLSGVRKDGTYYFSRITSDNLEMTRGMLEGFINGAENYNLSLMDKNVAESLDAEQSIEYLHVIKDAEGRVIAAIGQDGSYIISKLLARTIKLDYNALKQLEVMLQEDGFSPDMEELEEAVLTNTNAIGELSTNVANLSTQVESSATTILGEATTLVNQKTTNIEYSQLSDACKQAISGSQGGTITNNADEEDLTASGGALHFKDRDTSVGMAYVILRKNIDGDTSSPTYGKNILNPSLIDNVNNTIFVIKYDFDLYGKTLTLGNNVILSFEGGSIINTKRVNGEVDWAIIKLSSTTTIKSDYWCFTDCKFSRVSSSNRYNKAFHLKWIGIQDDGMDKYTLFRDLYTIIGTASIRGTTYQGLLSGTYPEYKPNFIISGRILCNSNEIYIPTSMNLYGENEAVILFSSSIGSYCVCISKITSVHNVTFVHTGSANFTGSIVTIDSSKRNDDIGLVPTGQVVLDNICIKGTSSVGRTTTQCTGLSVIASDEGIENETSSTYFHQIHIGVLDIRYCKVGLEIGLKKTMQVSDPPLIWGNGVVIDQAYTEGTEKCVYCHDNTGGNYGRCRIGWLTGQATKTSCQIVYIDGFKDFRIDNYMPYDTLAQEGSIYAPIAYIVNNGSLKVGFDNGTDAVASPSSEGYSFTDIRPLGTNTAYRIYSGTLCRFNKIFPEVSNND